jgi:hypothetical protein
MSSSSTVEDCRGASQDQPQWSERSGARDRNGNRNALFADLLITTGLRLKEASSLLTVEIDKSSAKRLLVKELLGAGKPVCIIDPKGDWWGIKLSRYSQGPASRGTSSLIVLAYMF